MADLKYLDDYELKLTENLLKAVGHKHLLMSDDLIEVWKDTAPSYMVDAVPNIVQYPLCAIGWAGYLGMASAKLWDKNPMLLRKNDGVDFYTRMRTPRGFDEMDEYIIEEVIGYLPETRSWQKIEDNMRMLAQLGLDTIRHENVEPQTEAAFHIYARTVKAVFCVGASLQLAAMGYKYTKLE
ncbi:MAG: hypothetical protein MJ002_01885 [Paludibacteraceae bacterium]|nr:hypothetical protein [Paludibacteraceae bacterium]